MPAAVPEAPQSRHPAQPGPGDAAATRARRGEVARVLAELLPPDCLLSREEELRPYECDGLAAYRQQPLLVALPRTEEQVCAVVRACRELGVPLVARGGGTGLSGGALPHAQGVLLSLARFDRILDIDPVARTARV
ncbi:MAG TPA: FAD-binding protein, partial [Steroidobacteraceae bacterium]|nr:FAD-binding protein [Steroidobacteraceae bacterium]